MLKYTKISKLRFLFWLQYIPYTTRIRKVIMFCYQWSPLALRKLTFIIFKIKILLSSHTEQNFTNCCTIWLIFLHFSLVLSRKSYSYLLHVPNNICILVYKIGRFSMTGVKITSYFSDCRFNYLWTRMNGIPLLWSPYFLGYCIFVGRLTGLTGAKPGGPGISMHIWKSV